MIRFIIIKFWMLASAVCFGFLSIQCAKETPKNVEALTKLLSAPTATTPSTSNSKENSSTTNASAVPLFVDNENGTVSASAQGLVWAKCPQSPTGNRFNPTSKFCNVDTFGRFNYCNQANGDCSSGSTGSILRLPFLNGAESPAFRSCQNLTLAGRTWRVPTRTELARFWYELYEKDTTGVFNGESGAGVDNRFWSSTGAGTTAGGVDMAWSVDGFNGTVGPVNQTVPAFLLRCVSDL